MTTDLPPESIGIPADESSVESDSLGWRLAQVLACSAIDPGLSGVLLFDLEPRLVHAVARLFSSILSGNTESVTPPIILGAASCDENLWTRTRLHTERDGLAFRTEPGPLIEGDLRSGAASLIVVPDLSRLSVDGMRAAVQCTGADVCVVEYSGLRHIARPRARWLATCPSAVVGRVSGHLLDRFAVRLPMAGLQVLGPARLAADVAPSCRTGVRCLPSVKVTDAALDRVRELLGSEPSVRRELALARLTRAVAALRGEGSATVVHCDEAAQLIGLTVSGPGLHSTVENSPSPLAPALRASMTRGDAVAGRPAAHMTEEQHVRPPGRPLLGAEPAENIGSLPGGVTTVLATPFPEDESAVLPDFAPLRSPWQRSAGPGSERGTAVGTRRAVNLRDLAYVRTVREAAVHQRVRRANRFTITPSDLHSHVRAGAPVRMLVLVLDHTCREGDWDWQESLTPFLHWAYVERAVVQMIQVGASDAADELRADSFFTRSVLDPRVIAGLWRPAGRATPLAHGIEQAVRVLHRAFRQHGGILAEAWLVVVTDGRGNVPLSVSHTGRQTGEVGTAGVEDALEMAVRIGAMNRMRVRAVVVDPARDAYGGLPFDLADAMGATVVQGRRARGAGARDVEGNIDAG